MAYYIENTKNSYKFILKTTRKWGKDDNSQKRKPKQPTDITEDLNLCRNQGNVNYNLDKFLQSDMRKYTRMFTALLFITAKIMQTT